MLTLPIKVLSCFILFLSLRNTLQSTCIAKSWPLVIGDAASSQYQDLSCFDMNSQTGAFITGGSSSSTSVVLANSLLSSSQNTSLFLMSFDANGLIIWDK